MCGLSCRGCGFNAAYAGDLGEEFSGECHQDHFDASQLTQDAASTTRFRFRTRSGLLDNRYVFPLLEVPTATMASRRQDRLIRSSRMVAAAMAQQNTSKIPGRFRPALCAEEPARPRRRDLEQRDQSQPKSDGAAVLGTLPRCSSTS